MVNLYERIEELCKNQKISISKLCSLAGVSSSVIYDIKSGRKSGLNRRTAEKIALVLQISVAELYGETEKAPDAKTPRAKENDEFIKIFETLPEEKQQQVLDYLRYVAGK